MVARTQEVRAMRGRAGPLRLVGAAATGRWLTSVARWQYLLASMPSSMTAVEMVDVETARR